MKVTLSGLLIAAIAMTLITNDASADQRSYVWTYEYQTVHQGEAELETYFTLSSPDKNKLEGNTTAEHRVELEVGMTDRFDVGIYQIFIQPPGESLRYKGFQVRGRYKLSEKGKLFFDPLIYLEYKGTPDFSEHGLEAKLVLAKDHGRFNLALNPILDFEFEDDTEVEVEYAAGLNYRVTDLLGIGLETKGSESGHYMGPVISHGGNYWVALGSLFNLGSVDEGKPELQIRMLMGFEF